RGFDKRWLFGERAKWVDVRAEKELIPPKESAWVEVAFRTTPQPSLIAFGLVVHFDQPKYGYSGIQFRSMSRSDLVFSQDRINFGKTKVGTRDEKTLKIEYAGDIEWRISSATCKNANLNVRLVETHRERTDKGYATVGYDLVVALRPDVPAGT